jgi:hypothetical protein
MLSKLNQLGTQIDGRYASDSELQFVDNYISSFDKRIAAYQTIKSFEKDIVEAVLTRLQTSHPDILLPKGENLQAKWRQDTYRVLRHSAMTVLVDDPELLKQQFLYWFQTIMQAFGAQQACDVTYRIMQDVVREMLPADIADILCPILEVSREMLGLSAKKS